MKYLVTVEPVPDEPRILSSDEATAAREWLERGVSEGWLESVYAFPETGGIMVVTADDHVALGARLAEYPIRHTVRLRTQPVVSITEGFGFLDTTIRRVN